MSTPVPTMRLIALAACLPLLPLAGLVHGQAAPPTSINEAKLRQVQNSSLSASKQFTVHGADLTIRSAFCILCEETAGSLGRLLKDDGKFTIPIVVVLKTPPDVNAAEPSAKPNISLMTHGGFHLQVTAQLRSDFRTEDFVRELVRVLLAERILRNHKDINTQRDRSILPEWLLTGVMQAMEFRSRSRPSVLFAAVFRSGQVYSIDRILAANPKNLDAMARGVYEVSSCALVLTLMDQPDGPIRVARFLNALAAESMGDRDLLQQHFPTLGASKNSLEKWWTLQMASLATPSAFETMTVSETEEHLDKALTLHFTEKIGEEPPDVNLSSDGKRTLFGWLKGAGNKGASKAADANTPPSGEDKTPPVPTLTGPPTPTSTPPPISGSAVTGPPSGAAAPVAPPIPVLSSPAPAAPPAPGSAEDKPAATASASTPVVPMPAPGAPASPGAAPTVTTPAPVAPPSPDMEKTAEAPPAAKTASPPAAAQHGPAAAPVSEKDKKTESKPVAGASAKPEGAKPTTPATLAPDKEKDKEKKTEAKPPATGAGSTKPQPATTPEKPKTAPKSDAKKKPEDPEAKPKPKPGPTTPGAAPTAPNKPTPPAGGAKPEEPKTDAPEPEKKRPGFRFPKIFGGGQSTMHPLVLLAAVAIIELTAAPPPPETKPKPGRENAASPEKDEAAPAETAPPKKPSRFSLKNLFKKGETEPKTDPPPTPAATPVKEKPEPEPKPRESTPKKEEKGEKEEPPVANPAPMPMPPAPIPGVPPTAAELESGAPGAPVEATPKKPAIARKPGQVPLEDYSRIWKRTDRENILQRNLTQLNAIKLRAHPLYKPLVEEYATLVQQLINGKDKGVAERLTALKLVRTRTHAQAKAVESYVDWYEAAETQTFSHLFDDYLKLRDRMDIERSPRSDAMSKYLDDMEKEYE